MNENLHDLSTHNASANKTLLGACRPLSGDQLTATASAAFLTGLGIELPDIQPWGYADDTGHGRFVEGT